MRNQNTAVLVVLGLSLLGGCVAKTDNIMFHRTQAPALPEGCPVNRIASDTAPYPVEDLVTVTVRYLAGGRDRTLRKIETDACYYGGDTVYKVKEEALNGVATQVTATVARRIGGVAPASLSAAPGQSAPTTVGPASPAGTAGTP